MENKPTSPQNTPVKRKQQDAIDEEEGTVSPLIKQPKKRRALLDSDDEEACDIDVAMDTTTRERAGSDAKSDLAEETDNSISKSPNQSFSQLQTPPKRMTGL